MIPIAGVLVMVQGVAEMVRCVVCLGPANGQAG